MSQHNELQKYPALQRALSAATGMDPREEGVTRLGETLTPVIDAWSQPEFAALREEALFAGFAGQSAVVGEFSAVALVNPAGSQRLTIIDRVYVRSGSLISILAGFGLQTTVEATLGSLNALFCRDTRLTAANFQTTPGQNVCQTRLVNGSDPATALLVSGFENKDAVTSGVDVDLELLPAIIEPGFAYVVVCAVVNTGLTVNFAGRERRVQAAEL